MAKALTDLEIAVFRERLCKEATQLFAERGYQGVTMRALAKQVGCSPMTPYRYFKSKEEIFAVVRAAAFTRLAEGCEHALQGVSNDLLAANQTSQAYLQFAMREPDAYRIMFELSQPDDSAYPELAKAVDSARRYMLGPVENLVEKGVLAGDANELSNLFWAGIHGVIVLYLAGKLEQETDVNALFTRMLMTLSLGSQGPNFEAATAELNQSTNLAKAV